MKIVPNILLIISLAIFLMNFANSDHQTSDSKQKTITRIWRGWTTLDNANEFEKTLTEVAIPGIQANRPNGCLGIQVLRRDIGSEVEFTTIMQFATIESVKQFAGENYELAHIDPKVKPLLLRYDSLVAHHQSLYTKVWEEEK